MILYSTHCAKCRVVEMKLARLGIEFTMVDDPDVVIEKGKEAGIWSAPLLEVEPGKILGFNEAVKFLNEVK